MQHYAAFRLGLHCMQKYMFRDSKYKGLIDALTQYFGPFGFCFSRKPEQTVTLH